MARKQGAAVGSEKTAEAPEWEKRKKTKAEARRLEAFVKESYVPRKGTPDPRRRMLEKITSLLEPTCPPGSVSARLSAPEAMARTLEQIGLDPVDFDEVVHEAHEAGFATSYLERLDKRRIAEMTLWEALEALTRPKPARGRPPAKGQAKPPACKEDSESED